MLIDGNKNPLIIKNIPDASNTSGVEEGLMVLLFDRGGNTYNKLLSEIGGGGGGSQDFQSVLGEGNSTELEFYKITPDIGEGRILSGIFDDNNTSRNFIGHKVLNTEGELTRSFGLVTSESTYFKFRDEVNDTTTIFEFPIETKPEGDYILATLDDIEGASQDLQSVLLTGSAGSLESPDTNYSTTLIFEAYDGGSYVLLQGNSDIKVGWLSIVSGNITLNNQEDVGGIQSDSRLQFETPIDSGTHIYNIPAKAEGTHTLATLDDINLQNVLDTNSTALEIDFFSISTTDFNRITLDNSSGIDIVSQSGIPINISGPAGSSISLDSITGTTINGGDGGLNLNGNGAGTSVDQGSLNMLNGNEIKFLRTGDGQKNINFGEATIGTDTFNLPSKGGIISTLATLDDISTISTAFVNETYSSTMSLAYDNENPNTEIDIIGNLDLTITGTANGDSGLINLYFSGTEVVTLNGFTNLIITGNSAMISVYFIHDTDGLKWYNSIDMNLLNVNFARQDNTRLYHNIKWFVPTGTISTVGTTATSTTAQFIASMVGAKLTINGESKIITAFTSTTVVTVASAYNINYVAVATGNWGVYSEAMAINAGETRLKSPTGAGVNTIFTNGNTEIAATLTGIGNVWNLGTVGLLLPSSGSIRHTSGGSTTTGTIDIGLRRNSAGVYEIYDGVTATGLLANRRDLLVRNIISSSNIYANDAAADADATLPSGALYKITGSRTILQKP